MILLGGARDCERTINATLTNCGYGPPGLFTKCSPMELQSCYVVVVILRRGQAAACGGVILHAAQSRTQVLPGTSSRTALGAEVTPPDIMLLQRHLSPRAPSTRDRDTNSHDSVILATASLEEVCPQSNSAALFLFRHQAPQNRLVHARSTFPQSPQFPASSLQAGQSPQTRPQVVTCSVRSRSLPVWRSDDGSTRCRVP